MDNKSENKQKESLAEEQIKENQNKFDEYNKFFKIFLVSLCIMFAIIVGIVATLIISNS